MTKLLTPAQVADLLGVRPSTVRKWCREGKLESIRLGRLVRIQSDQLGSICRQSENKKVEKPRPQGSPQVSMCVLSSMGV